MSATTAASPHVHGGVTTSRTMWTVTLCLLPAATWGVFAFGPEALWILCAAVLSSLLTEIVIGLAARRLMVADGSALLTGLLVGMILPATVPLYIPITASVVATGVAKWAFGGLGSNWVNPALSGWLVVYFSWPSAMSRWVAPGYWGAADAIASATALASPDIAAPTGVGLGAVFTRGIESLLGHPGTGVAGLVNHFIGNRAGAIGEGSAFLLGAAVVVLVARRVVAWRIPVVFVLTVALEAWVLDGRVSGSGFFRGNAALHLVGGGLLLGAIMASDPVTSPFTPAGMVIYAIGCGSLTYLVRRLGVYPDGVAFAVVLMNMVVPTINHYTRRRGRAHVPGLQGERHG